MSNALFAIAVSGIVWGVVSAVAMASYIASRGYTVNFLLFRLLIFRYMHQYREVSRRESGRTGVWFYSYIISMNIALVCAIIGAIVR